MIAAKIEREIQGFIPGVQMGKLNFDDVWQLYNEVSGHHKLLEEMIQRKMVDVQLLRSIAMADLERSLSNADQTSGKPSGPPAEEDFPVITSNAFRRWPGLRDVGPRNLVYRILLYGSFMQAYLGVSAAVIQAALRSDGDIIAMTFDQLINANVRQLLTGPNPLFSAEILRYKGVEYIQHRSPTFGGFINSFGKWILDEHIMPASDLAALFQRDCIDKLDAVTLLDTWYEWPIQDYGHSLGISPAQQQVLAALYKQLQVARSGHQSEAKRSRKAFDHGVVTAQQNRDRLLGQQPTSIPSSSSQSASSSQTNEIPIVHVKNNGTVIVTGTEISKPSVTPERLAAEYDLEEMRLQEQMDTELSKSRKSLEDIEKAINDAWKDFLHPELAKKPESTASPVQLNLNFSLLGGLNLSATPQK
jgi:hypothetical protein